MTPTIRLAGESDGERIRAIYAPHIRESATSFEQRLPTVAEVQRRVAATIETHPWLVCEHEGQVVGYAYASSHRTRESVTLVDRDLGLRGRRVPPTGYRTRVV